VTRHPHTFSKRTAWDLATSDHSTAIARAKAAGEDLLDLTISNPTVSGFDYDADAILGPLAARETVGRSLVYDPDPRGMRSAREAVSRYYADHGASVGPDSLILTTSTSEAYSFIFRLICDAGDEVLVAQPSYPLFDFLADLDDVKLTPYPLFYDFGWWIDFAELKRRITPRTRAILVVHPNNPTGHWTHRAERERLEALCQEHRLALIVDEVFLDYPLNERPAQSFATGPHPALTFVLSGISKIAALPQMKVAWLAALGPMDTVSEALTRLEVISDTFLSMNAPAQLALPHWLARRGSLQRQITQRTQMNLALLRMSALEVLNVEAGWSAVARFSTTQIEPPRTVAEAMLEETRVLVYPGIFYGLADSKAIVISLLAPADRMQAAMERLRTVFGA
jgi:alanine-synthesizing transaminase